MGKGITIYISSIKDSEELITGLLENEFGITKADSYVLYKNNIADHFAQLKDNCFLLAESPYVDKVYRDSYYHYYSSKHLNYQRDCIRISIFENEINEDDFRNAKQINNIQERYLGFIILRPTDPYLIGRSVLAPKALKRNDFVICSTKIESTANGVKLNVNGFPYSSQDTETISCAETTLWAIMEYFGTRYIDYHPVLPSQIIKVLDKVSFERQVPSKGLNISQMSYALKEFGFGSRIYSKKEYGEQFERILSSYIESGIPIITAVDNHTENGNIAHAMLCVGHENITDGHFDALNQTQLLPGTANSSVIDALKSKSVRLYDCDDISKKFVFVDDNCSVYQKANLQAPCQHYPHSEWKKCSIKYLIVPLYKRIYLEAYEAKHFLLNFLLVSPFQIGDNKELLLRFFLTSSRSFKDKLSMNDSFSEDVKEKILAKPLPKFIWIGELSTKELIKQRKANGIVVLDATEANTEPYKPLVFAAYEGKVFEYDEHNSDIIPKSIPLAEFLIYENNLIN